MKPFTPNQQRREQLVKLMDFARGQKDGAKVSWVEVEQATGVPMKVGGMGRDLFRLACKRVARRYLALDGLGVEFSSADNANEIASKEIGKIGSAVVKASKTTDILYDRHKGELTSEQARLLTAKQAFLSSLNLSTSLSKRLPAK